MFNWDRVLNRVFFFFQAEDGIRDLIVTGVQTCALPISPLAREEVADRAAQAVVRDIVGAMRERGIEAAQPLVFTAGAGLEARDSIGDAMLDRGVVADVEVQILQVFKTSPVTPVEHARPLQVEGPGDQLAPTIRANQADVALEALAHLGKELARQITAAPVEFLDRGEVEIEHRAEDRVGDVVARVHLDGHALGDERGALVADRVAAFALERAQVVLESGEAGVAPMVLVAEALEETEFAQRRRLVGQAEVYMRRGELVVRAELRKGASQGRDQRPPRDAGRGEKAPSAMRRKWHAGQQLGIVADAAALGRVSPS